MQVCVMVRRADVSTVSPKPTSLRPGVLPARQQMRELLSENEQLAVRNFQAFARRGGGFGRAKRHNFRLKCVRIATFAYAA